MPNRHLRPSIEARLEHVHCFCKRELLADALNARANALAWDVGRDEDDLPP